MIDIRCGDALEVLGTLPEASVDAVVTDPPYGLGFMGKAWDHGIPGEPFWSEALRVAKPGAHLAAFGGTRTYHRLACAIEDAGWEIRDCLMWLYGSGFPKSHNGEWGGTALKPAWEPIILARKPLAGTVAANVQEHGTGALNVDGCRIPIESERREWIERYAGDVTKHAETGWGTTRLGGNTAGRWPANVLLDEEAAAALDEQSDTHSAGHARPDTPGGTYTGATAASYVVGVGKKGFRIGDSGGASRFFYTAKASSGERHYAGKNTHPTVKPVDLMRWLCRLVTPPGGLIVDPFMGSGSTGIAALAEGFRFLGCDNDPAAVTIARKRVSGPLFAEVTT